MKILETTRPQIPGSSRRALLEVWRRHGRNPVAQCLEIARLRLGFGRLGASEYFDFRLFDEGLSFTEKQAFLGWRRQGTVDSLVAREWWALLEDKLALYAFLAGLGFPIPETMAVYHRFRSVPTATELRSEEELIAYLTDPLHYPFFSKPNWAGRSLGVAYAHRYEPARDRICFSGGRETTPAEFASETRRYLDRGYLFQRPLRPHPDLSSALGDHLASLRMLVLIEHSGPTVFAAALKIPVGGNIADNFWRDGNLVADVDLDSGRLRRVIRGAGLDQQEPLTHPDSGAELVGLALPDWPDVMRLVARCASALPEVTVQAWDIALGAEGPVPLEANVGGDLNLPQLASGRGLLETALATHLARQRSLSASAVTKRSPPRDTP